VTKFLEILKVIIIGIVEGITEWLPISSTGHMILVDELIKLSWDAEFKNMFLVVIQLGATLAVPVLFWNKLNPFSKKKTEVERKTTLSLWLKVIVGAIPAAIAGLLLDVLFDDLLDEHFVGALKISVIAAALIIYGIAFIIIEKIWVKRNEQGKQFRVLDVNDLTYSDAIKIGAFQVLSLIPGTSRSGSTIIGGLLCGVSRSASAEFSFFMAIPIMLGASGLKLVKYMVSSTSTEPFKVICLGIGLLVSFLVSLAVIKFLMDFVKKHSFTSFGIYRIILGIAVILFIVI
jgi:undecaprenyl-diphosphatase